MSSLYHTFEPSTVDTVHPGIDTPEIGWYPISTKNLLSVWSTRIDGRSAFSSHSSRYKLHRPSIMRKPNWPLWFHFSRKSNRRCYVTEGLKNENLNIKGIFTSSLTTLKVILFTKLVLSGQCPLGSEKLRNIEWLFRNFRCPFWWVKSLWCWSFHLDFAQIKCKYGITVMPSEFSETKIYVCWFNFVFWLFDGYIFESCEFQPCLRSTDV